MMEHGLTFFTQFKLVGYNLITKLTQFDPTEKDFKNLALSLMSTSVLHCLRQLIMEDCCGGQPETPVSMIDTSLDLGIQKSCKAPLLCFQVSLLMF